MRNLPPICKNLLLLNIIVWLFDMLMERFGISLTTLLGLHYFTAEGFYIWQPLTYMFMRALLLSLLKIPHGKVKTIVLHHIPYIPLFEELSFLFVLSHIILLSELI